MAEPAKKTLPGGAFLVTDAAPADTYTPEDLSEDDRAIKDAADDFAKREIAPRAEAMDSHDDALLRSLMLQAGSLGFLGIDIAEAHGGLGLDLIASALVFEAMGAAGNGSFAVTLGAHTGIGTWPILYFGTDAQRAAYLPGIASGEKIAAYALTEAGSGSDALGARTTAVLSEDGSHWIVNGGKVFITNAAIADVFTVFVKIGGQNACLIVKKGTPGFSIGKEERKLGIKGSSTCSLAFDDARVPAGDLLGAIGKGHKIVLNTLNLGRFKLGCAAVGGLKASVSAAVEYAAGRKQFGRPILDFDAIRQKIADMTVKAWVGESMAYRAAGLLAERLEGVPPGEEAAKAIEEHTVECSLVKVALSEMLWDSVNHGVQVLGGYGYIEEGYPAARALRDARINLIFEGTNEINRMLAVDALTKQAMKGRVDLFGSFAALPPGPSSGTSFRDALASAKHAAVHALGEAVQRWMQALKDEQQVLLALADLLIAVYGMDSALLRLEKLEAAGAATPLHRDVVAAHFEETRRLVRDRAETVLCAVHADPAARAAALARSAALQGGVREDLVGARKRIGEAAAARGGYPF
ncbi:MAG TPA: acyl-CoA dehydrogenase family protein [Candidatus Binatia bacterium]|nr:acyl-CoA dehydrogenase family protein [Candidatus Binatia bacterium]